MRLVVCHLQHSTSKDPSCLQELLSQERQLSFHLVCAKMMVLLLWWRLVGSGTGTDQFHIILGRLLKGDIDKPCLIPGRIRKAWTGATDGWMDRDWSTWIIFYWGFTGESSEHEPRNETKRKPQRQSETCDWLSGLQVNRMNLQLSLRSAEPGSNSDCRGEWWIGKHFIQSFNVEKICFILD